MQSYKYGSKSHFEFVGINRHFLTSQLNLHLFFLIMTKDDFSVEGKVAIVTGSGRENGIGAAIVRALVRNGAAVAINYVSEGTASRAERFAEILGSKAVAIRADVSTGKGAQSLVEKTLEAFKVDHVDILGMIVEACRSKHLGSSFDGSEQCGKRRPGQYAKLVGRGDQEVF